MNISGRLILVLTLVLSMLICPGLHLWGQQAYLDSLENKLSTVATVEEKVDLLLELSSRAQQSDPERSIRYIDEALLLARKNGLKAAEGIALRNKGIYEEMKGLGNAALGYFQEAEGIFLKLGDSSNYYQSIFEQAIFHNNKSNYLLATRDFLICLAYFEREKDTARISKCLNNLGVVSLELRSYEAARDFFQRSYRLKRTKGNPARLASTLNNLSYCFYLNGQIDSSIYYAKEALSLQDGSNLWSLNLSHRNLAASYLKQEKYKEALFHGEEALEITESLGGAADKAGTLLELSQVKMGMGRLEQAERDAQLSLQIIDSIGLYSNFRSDLLQHHANLNIAQGNYREAVGFLQKNQVVRDSIFQQDKIAEISRLETLYETEKKEQQLEILESEKELQEEKLARARQNLIFLAIFSVLLFSLVLIFILLSQQRKKNNQLLKENNQYLRELNETKDQLFSIIAHDLKNPLSAFRSLTVNLAKKWDLLEKADIYPFIQTLSESSNKLYDLLQNLLEWAISQAGRLNPVIQKMEAGDMVHGTLLPLRNLLQLKNLDLDVLIEDGPIFFESDENILRTVLRNLVANAIKFTPQNGQVHVSARLSDAFIEFQVKDNGIGISVSDQAKLFDKEASAREIGDSPEKGSGLGLILCKELLEKIDGEISVSSAPGKGSIFIVKIPYLNSTEGTKAIS